jgi:hypothetical protein
MVPIIRIMVSEGKFIDRVEIVIHFGMNPVSGGIPLNDRSKRGIIN